MIIATDLELRAGARTLVEPVSFRVQPGDRIGLVGRNGAGKTTLLKTLARETLPFAGKIEGRGELPGATSAVMEMCIDNPREGFSNIFDTHPPVDARVAAGSATFRICSIPRAKARPTRAIRCTVSSASG